MRRALLVIVVATMLVLAGCGGGAGGDESNVQDDPSADDATDDGNGGGEEETESSDGDDESDDADEDREPPSDPDESSDGEATTEEPAGSEEPGEEPDEGGEETGEGAGEEPDEDPEEESDEEPNEDPNEDPDEEPNEDPDEEPDEGDSDREPGETEAAPITDPAAVGDAIRVAELNVAGVGPDEEYVVLENVGDDPLDLSGWTVRDREDDGQVARGLDPFAFPDGFVLDADERVTIRTGDGEPTDTDLYWGYGVNVWNADGDVVILQSPAGETVLEHPYGDVTPDDPDDETEGGQKGNEAGEDETEDDEMDGGPGETDDTAAVDGELEIHHIDVGQADSTLLVTPEEETILIDTGDWRDDGEEVLAYLEAEGVDRIDHLVATHGHADHVGGHPAVIEHFETERDGVGAAYDSGVPHDSATYGNYLDAIEEHDVDLFLVEEGDELPIDDPAVEARVLNPPAGDSGDDVDYNSVALAVEFGEFRYLTTGDAGADAEQRLADERPDELAADVYQAGHHGSTTSSTATFVEAVDPEIAVISSAYDSQYGHPHDEVLERFAETGIETYWTGVHGDIVLTTDGTDVDVETAAEFSTDAADLLAAKPDEEAAATVEPTGVDRAREPIPG